MTSFVIGTLVIDSTIWTVFDNTLCYNSVPSKYQLLLAQQCIIDRKTTFRYSITVWKCQGCLCQVWHSRTSYHPFHPVLPTLSASMHRCYWMFQNLAEACRDCYRTCRPTAAILTAQGHRTHWFLSLSSCVSTSGLLLICLCLLICCSAEDMTNLSELD